MEDNRKRAKYQRISEQYIKLIEKCDEPIARMATLASLLHFKMDNFFWTGFYLLKDDELTVGPYQGFLACMKLKKHTGVCWASVLERKAIVVPDVHQFPGHIACDERSNSEIALPVFNKQNQIIAVLDIDSKKFDNFDLVDAEELEKLVKYITH